MAPRPRPLGRRRVPVRRDDERLRGPGWVVDPRVPVAVAEWIAARQLRPTWRDRPESCVVDDQRDVGEVRTREVHRSVQEEGRHQPRRRQGRVELEGRLLAVDVILAAREGATAKPGDLVRGIRREVGVVEAQADPVRPLPALVRRDGAGERIEVLGFGVLDERLALDERAPGSVGDPGDDHDLLEVLELVERGVFLGLRRWGGREKEPRQPDGEAQGHGGLSRTRPTRVSAHREPPLPGVPHRPAAAVRTTRSVGMMLQRRGGDKAFAPAFRTSAHPRYAVDGHTRRELAPAPQNVHRADRPAAPMATSPCAGPPPAAPVAPPATRRGACT